MASNCILASVEKHALASPRTIALRSGSRTLSYRELFDQVNTLASGTIPSGCAVVGTLIDNGIDWVLIDLALLESGVIHVPIPSFFSQQQMIHLIRDTGMSCVITDRPQIIQSLAMDTLSGSSPLRITESLYRIGNRAMDGYPVTAEIAKITYTSGTTGAPKGVRITRRALELVAESLRDAVSPSEPQRHLSVTPLTTLLENIGGIYASLLEGIEVVVPPLAEVGLTPALQLDPMKYLDAIQHHRPDTLILVPQLLMVLVTAMEHGLSFGEFKFIAAGGGRISKQLLDRAEALRLPVFQGYGLSECASVVSLCRPGANRPGSVGRILSHCQVRIAADSEIEVKGDAVCAYQQEDRDPEAWLQTGDLGFLDSDGYLYITGRKRDVFINALGRNVNPEWPESELMQQAAVRSAMVTGEGRMSNLALIWARNPSGAYDQIERAVQCANANLPNYAQIHHWYLVESDDSDLFTTNGRVRRKEASQRFRDRIEQHYSRLGANERREFVA